MSGTTATVINVTDANLCKLIKLLGMTASDNDGESANAGRLANRLLLSMGVSWQDLLTPPEEPPPSVTVNVGGQPAAAPPPPPPPQPQAAPGVQPSARKYRGGGSARAHYMATHVPAGRHKTIAAEILAHHSHVIRNSNEHDFVTDTAASIYDYLTNRQYVWLAAIANRAGLSF